MDVLLGHDVGAPRGHPAGAVVDRADHLRSGRVGIGLETVVAGGWTGEDHFRRRGDAPVELAVFDHLPFAAILADLDDRTTVRGHLDVNLVFGQCRHF